MTTTHIMKNTPVHCRSSQQCNRFLTLINNNIPSRVAAVNVYVSRNEVKKQSQYGKKFNQQLSISQKQFSNPAKHIPGLLKDFQGPSSFSSTFKALNS